MRFVVEADNKGVKNTTIQERNKKLPRRTLFAQSKTVTSTSSHPKSLSPPLQVSNCPNNDQHAAVFHSITDYWAKDAPIDMMEIDYEVLNPLENKFECSNFSGKSVKSLKRKRLNENLDYPRRKRQKISGQFFELLTSIDVGGVGHVKEHAPKEIENVVESVERVTNEGKEENWFEQFAAHGEQERQRREHVQMEIEQKWVTKWEETEDRNNVLNDLCEEGTYTNSMGLESLRWIIPSTPTSIN